MSNQAARIIGDQLRRARETQGLSVAQAAKVLKVERQTLYNYENGQRLPKMRILVAAAAAWSWPFEVSGCKLVPEESKRQLAPKPQPVQGVFPFGRTRVFKAKSVKIRRRDHDIVITAVARIMP
jgi:transcriptional regulator with XRE-family HTH domain